jgi:hypothetical protein
MLESLNVCVLCTCIVFSGYHWIPLATTVKPSRPETIVWELLTGQARNEANSCQRALPSITDRQPEAQTLRKISETSCYTVPKIVAFARSHACKHVST